MRTLESRMDAFAARKGTLKNGSAQPCWSAYQAFDAIGMLQYKVYRYPQLQRVWIPNLWDIAGRFSV